MENFLWLYISICMLGAIIFSLEAHKRRTKHLAGFVKYKYVRRDYVMTKTESVLFRRLEKIAGDRYYIFPQIHLSSLLNHAVKGQNWRVALAAIQRKSVDFILVDKTTLRTTYVIELDDITHDTLERKERDGKVERYLLDVDMPLVRLRNIDKLTDEDIENAFRVANTRVELTNP